MLAMRRLNNSDYYWLCLVIFTSVLFFNEFGTTGAKRKQLTKIKEPDKNKQLHMNNARNNYVSRQNGKLNHKLSVLKQASVDTHILDKITSAETINESSSEKTTRTNIHKAGSTKKAPRNALSHGVETMTTENNNKKRHSSISINEGLGHKDDDESKKKVISVSTVLKTKRQKKETKHQTSKSKSQRRHASNAGNDKDSSSDDNSRSEKRISSLDTKAIKEKPKHRRNHLRKSKEIKSSSDNTIKESSKTKVKPRKEKQTLIEAEIKQNVSTKSGTKHVRRKGKNSKRNKTLSSKDRKAKSNEKSNNNIKSKVISHSEKNKGTNRKGSSSDDNSRSEKKILSLETKSMKNKPKQTRNHSKKTKAIKSNKDKRIKESSKTKVKPRKEKQTLTEVEIKENVSIKSGAKYVKRKGKNSKRNKTHSSKDEKSKSNEESKKNIKSKKNANSHNENYHTGRSIHDGYSHKEDDDSSNKDHSISSELESKQQNKETKHQKSKIESHRRHASGAGNVKEQTNNDIEHSLNDDQYPSAETTSSESRHTAKDGQYHNSENNKRTMTFSSNDDKSKSNEESNNNIKSKVISHSEKNKGTNRKGSSSDDNSRSETKILSLETKAMKNKPKQTRHHSEKSKEIKSNKDKRIKERSKTKVNPRKEKQTLIEAEIKENVSTKSGAKYVKRKGKNSKRNKTLSSKDRKSKSNEKSNNNIKSKVISHSEKNKGTNRKGSSSDDSSKSETKILSLETKAMKNKPKQTRHHSEKSKEIKSNKDKRIKERSKTKVKPRKEKQTLIEAEIKENVSTKSGAKYVKRKGKNSKRNKTHSSKDEKSKSNEESKKNIKSKQNANSHNENYHTGKSIHDGYSHKEDDDSSNKDHSISSELESKQQNKETKHQKSKIESHRRYASGAGNVKEQTNYDIEHSFNDDQYPSAKKISSESRHTAKDGQYHNSENNKSNITFSSKDDRSKSNEESNKNIKSKVISHSEKNKGTNRKGSSSDDNSRSEKNISSFETKARKNKPKHGRNHSEKSKEIKSNTDKSLKERSETKVNSLKEKQTLIEAEIKENVSTKSGAKYVRTNSENKQDKLNMETDEITTLPTSVANEIHLVNKTIESKQETDGAQASNPSTNAFLDSLKITNKYKFTESVENDYREEHMTGNHITSTNVRSTDRKKETGDTTSAIGIITDYPKAADMHSTTKQRQTDNTLNLQITSKTKIENTEKESTSIKYPYTTPGLDVVETQNLLKKLTSLNVPVTSFAENTFLGTEKSSTKEALETESSSPPMRETSVDNDEITTRKGTSTTNGIKSNEHGETSNMKVSALLAMATLDKTEKKQTTTTQSTSHFTGSGRLDSNKIESDISAVGDPLTNIETSVSDNIKEIERITTKPTNSTKGHEQLSVTIQKPHSTSADLVNQDTSSTHVSSTDNKKKTGDTTSAIEIPISYPNAVDTHTTKQRQTDNTLNLQFTSKTKTENTEKESTSIKYPFTTPGLDTVKTHDPLQKLSSLNVPVTSFAENTFLGTEKSSTKEALDTESSSPPTRETSVDNDEITTRKGTTTSNGIKSNEHGEKSNMNVSTLISMATLDKTEKKQTTTKQSTSHFTGSGRLDSNNIESDISAVSDPLTNIETSVSDNIKDIERITTQPTHSSKGREQLSVTTRIPHSTTADLVNLDTSSTNIRSTVRKKNAGDTTSAIGIQKAYPNAVDKHATTKQLQTDKTLNLQITGKTKTENTEKESTFIKYPFITPGLDTVETQGPLQTLSSLSVPVTSFAENTFLGTEKSSTKEALDTERSSPLETSVDNDEITTRKGTTTSNGIISNEHGETANMKASTLISMATLDKTEKTQTSKTHSTSHLTDCERFHGNNIESDISAKVVPVLKRPYKQRSRICKPELNNCCVGGEITLNMGTFGQNRGSRKGNVDGIRIPTWKRGDKRWVRCSNKAVIVASFEELDQSQCAGCLSGPYCGRRMLKVQFDLSSNSRKNTLFYITDGGDNDNGAFIAAEYPHIFIYENDENAKANKTALLKIDKAIGPLTTKLTVYISNEFVRIISDSGLDHSMCHPQLFHLNGQMDILYPDGSPNVIKILMNHKTSDKNNAHVGVGVCNAVLSWECPWK